MPAKRPKSPASAKATARLGRHYAAPAKTPIAFMGRIRFAGVTKMTADSLDCNFGGGFAAPTRQSARTA